MTKRFSEPSKTCVSFALAAAGELGHTYVGSEHLLLGIISACNDPLFSLFSDYRVLYSDLRERIVSLVGMGAKTDVSVDDMTPTCKKILLRASLVAKGCGSKFIEPQHLLLALLREECVAIRLIAAAGADIASLCEKASELCEKQKAEPAIRRNTPVLDKTAIDLTERAAAGLLDPVFGREREEERILSILMRRRKNNPCLVGEAGVGKTAIAESIATRIACDRVPPELIGKRIMSLELSGMVAGTKYRGEFEERIQNLLSELRSESNIILFIDEIHTIVGAGAAEGAIDASNILKPALARGELRLIGATTPKEYRRYIEKDSALERRFQPVTINPPSIPECTSILLGLKSKYERFFGLVITEEAAKRAVLLSDRYVNDRALPDKAIDLVDEACAKKRICGGDTVTSEDIALCVFEKTGVPVARLCGDEMRNLPDLKAAMNAELIGQQEAVDRVCSALYRLFSGIRRQNRPAASFLFYGAPGVGKTECAKLIAKHFFGGESCLLRFDMSEYSEAHTVSRLIGAPPGYKGCGEGGLLTEKVRRRPHSILLFDEIEKAHPAVRALLLQILDEGRLTDSDGISVSFVDTIVVLTSNLFTVHSPIGYTEKEREFDASPILSRELCDRIGEKIGFLPLSKQSQIAIAARFAAEFAQTLLIQGITVFFDESFLQAVVEENSGKGIRSMLGFMERLAGDLCSREILSGNLRQSDHAVLENDGEYKIRIGEGCGAY